VPKAYGIANEIIHFARSLLLLEEDKELISGMRKKNVYSLAGYVKSAFLSFLFSRSDNIQ